MYDPLDTLTLDLTAKRAFCGEINTYAAWAASQGVKGLLMSENFYGKHRRSLLVANEQAAIIERRELAGLKRYERDMFDNMLQWLDDNIAGLDPSMLYLHGGEFSMGVSAGEPADPVYLLHRQYNTGPFNL